MACRQVDFKNFLVRLAARAGEVTLDWKGELGGRGGYLHPRSECLDRFLKAKVSRFTSLGRGLAREERLNLINTLAAHLAPNARV